MDIKTEIRPGRTVNVAIDKHPLSDTTIFMIHGLGGRSEQWRKQRNHLKEHYNLVIPDLLGHGKSDKPTVTTTNPYQFTEFSKDLEVIFNQFATRQNIIIGHSYGGALATQLTFNHQDRINKLILICPIACTPNINIPLVYYLPAFILEWLRPRLERQFLRLAFDITANPALVTEEARASRSNPMRIIKSMIRGMKDIPPINIKMIITPTLIILGDHDGIVPPGIPHDYYQSLPNHQFITIAHTEHMVMLEKPEQINAIISRFL